MNTFDNDPFRARQAPTPESFENQSHVIMRNPIEIDLDQKDRAPEGAMEAITGFKETKLIAEIKTPSDTVGVTHTQFPNLEAVIMLLSENNPLARIVLEPGETWPLGETSKDGKCSISLDETGRHLIVYAENPDKGYEISTRELEQFQVPEAPQDDPES